MNPIAGEANHGFTRHSFFSRSISKVCSGGDTEDSFHSRSGIESTTNIVIFSDIDTLVSTISPSDSDEIPPYRCLFRFNNQIDKHITS